MRQLPSSWAWASLADVASWGSGGTPTAGNPRFYGGEIPWAVIGDLNDAIVIKTANSITNEGLASSSAKIVSEGAILIAMYGSIGKLGIAGRPMATNQAIAFACANEHIIEKSYLFWFLSSERNNFVQAGKGATQKNISQTVLKSWPIPVPPLPEQRRIVAALEDHLSRLDAAVVSALTAARKAGALRRRALADLVAPDSSGSWTKYKLGDVSKSVRNGMFVSRPGREPNGVPILRISAVRSLNLDLSDLRYSAQSLERVQREGYLLGGGDLLFTRYNGNPEYVGVCAVVPQDLEPLTYPDKLIRVSPDRALVDPVYLAMACSAGVSRQAIRSAVKTTAGQAGISGGEIKRILLYLPDLNDQRRRAAEFQEHDDAMRHVEEDVKAIAKRGDYLRRSLLTEAFAGRLVPQDPAEESASVPLERIRAKQTAQLRTRRRPKIATHAPQEETLL
jgi:type I restriction enzyme, S subunit